MNRIIATVPAKEEGTVQYQIHEFDDSYSAVVFMLDSGYECRTFRGDTWPHDLDINNLAPSVTIHLKDGSTKSAGISDNRVHEGRLNYGYSQGEELRRITVV